MRRSTERILTTHVGSLIRPAPLLPFIRAKQSGQPYDPRAYGACLASSVADVVREQAAAGTTIVFSTHLLDQVERLCSHAAIIREGKLIRSGTLEEICGTRPLEEVFVELTQHAA